MLALVVTPGVRSSAELVDVAEPGNDEGAVLIETLAVGVCGTDVEIVRGDYGVAPKGEQRLVLGHEALGRVLSAPPASSLSTGDLVVPIVRHPDAVPCPNCAIGEWDMCRNGRYTEHGINERHGFARERFRANEDRIVKVPSSLGILGVLLEPASIIAKAREHIERIGSRAFFAPRRVLVTGAGPIGLLAAMFGVQRGLDVHVLDRVEDGPKPSLVRDLGATYHQSTVVEAGDGADIVIECTGVAQLVIDAMTVTAPGGVVCLTGVSSGGRALTIDAGALNRSMVLENDAVFGSVNANRRHYETGASALGRADRAWLSRLITRRVSLPSFADALFHREPRRDVKVVLAVSHEAC